MLLGISRAQCQAGRQEQEYRALKIFTRSRTLSAAKRLISYKNQALADLEAK